MFIVPIIKSAIKRVEVNKRQQTENRGPKSELQTTIKKFRALLAEKKIDEAEKLMPEVVSIVDSAARKGIIKKENADRKKARIATELQKAKIAK